jgi:hypothetical protein
VAETATYVYAVGRQLDPERLSDLTGLRGSEVRTIEHRELVAVVSTVDLQEFGETALRRNLEDIRWLEAVARRHDEVVRRAAAATTALAPFRLATIYNSDDGVRDRIDQVHDDLVRALDRIEGRSEWSVKAYSRTPQEPTVQVPAGPPDGIGSGLAYLERRRAELRDRETAAADDLALADQLFRDLAAGGEAARRLAPQDQRLSGRPDKMALNGTFLVDDDRASDFFGLVERMEHKYSAYRIEFDGPWPPYSFATLDHP